MEQKLETSRQALVESRNSLADTKSELHQVMNTNRQLEVNTLASEDRVKQLEKQQTQDWKDEQATDCNGGETLKLLKRVIHDMRKPPHPTVTARIPDYHEEMDIVYMFDVLQFPQATTTNVDYAMLGRFAYISCRLGFHVGFLDTKGAPRDIFPEDETARSRVMDKWIRWVGKRWIQDTTTNSRIWHATRGKHETRHDY
jgi:hypothetical protein